jgi:hypothetical protein
MSVNYVFCDFKTPLPPSKGAFPPTLVFFRKKVGEIDDLKICKFPIINKY